MLVSATRTSGAGTAPPKSSAATTATSAAGAAPARPAAKAAPDAPKQSSGSTKAAAAGAAATSGTAGSPAGSRALAGSAAAADAKLGASTEAPAAAGKPAVPAAKDADHPQPVTKPANAAAKLDAAVPPQDRPRLVAGQQAAGKDPASQAAYWQAHPYYVDDQDTVYAASYDTTKQQLTLERGGVAGGPTFSDEEKQSIAAGTGGPYEVDAAGHVSEVVTDPKTGAVSRRPLPDTHTVDVTQVVHADGRRDVSTVDHGELPATAAQGGGTVQSARTLHLDASGASIGMTMFEDRYEQLDTFAGHDTSSVVVTDAAGNLTSSRESDRLLDSTAGKRTSQNRTIDTTYAAGVPTSSREETFIDTGASTNTPLQQTATADTQYDANGLPALVRRHVDTFTGGVDGNQRTFQDHSLVDSTVAFVDGKTTYVESTTHDEVDSRGDGDTPVHTVNDSTVKLGGTGTPIEFDAQGKPTNATPRVDSRIVTTLTSPDDRSAQTSIDQHSTGDGTHQVFDRTRITSTQFDGNPNDGKVLQRSALDYSGDALDPATGMPRTGSDGQPVEGEHVGGDVDNRSWWDRNSGWLAAGLSIVGGVLSVIPLGVTQVVGGAMLLAGSAIAVSKDLPAFVEHPSWQGALALGLDTVGGVAGVGAVAGAFARGAAAATGAAARVYNVTETMVKSLPAKGVLVAAGADQAATFADHAIHGQLTAGDWIGLATVGVTAGAAARFGGRASAAEVAEAKPTPAYRASLVDASNPRNATVDVVGTGDADAEAAIRGQLAGLGDGQVRVVVKTGTGTGGLLVVAPGTETYSDAEIRSAIALSKAYPDEVISLRPSPRAPKKDPSYNGQNADLAFVDRVGTPGPWIYDIYTPQPGTDAPGVIKGLVQKNEQSARRITNADGTRAKQAGLTLDIGSMDAAGRADLVSFLKLPADASLQEIAVAAKARVEANLDKQGKTSYVTDVQVTDGASVGSSAEAASAAPPVGNTPN